MRFEAEEVKAVTLGAGWVAAVTSRNFLRIFTEGGLQVCCTTNSFYTIVAEIVVDFLPFPLFSQFWFWFGSTQ